MGPAQPRDSAGSRIGVRFRGGGSWRNGGRASLPALVDRSGPVTQPLGLEGRVIFGAAQTKARGDGVARGQFLGLADAAVGVKRPEFRIDPQQEMPVAAVGLGRAV